jgi:hypothetical protein
MSMMMTASTSSNCAKKKKRSAQTLSSKIQKEVQNLILAPAFDEAVYKSKVMLDEDKQSLLYKISWQPA